jgi:hypothetical protein
MEAQIMIERQHHAMKLRLSIAQALSRKTNHIEANLAK